MSESVNVQVDGAHVEGEQIDTMLKPLTTRIAELEAKLEEMGAALHARIDAAEASVRVVRRMI